MQPQFFRIHVTPDLKGTPMRKGHLDANGNIEGSTEEVIVNPPIQWIPMSYSKTVKKVLESGKYNGQIEFCDASEKGAQVIEVHYVPGCPSLDRKWQEDNGYSPKKDAPVSDIDAEAEIGREYLANTVYDFDLSKEDPLFVTFLKHHDVNGTNKKRDQDTRILFVELDGDKSVANKKKEFEKEEALFNMKKSLLEDDNVVGILSHVFDVSPKYDIGTRRDMLVEMLTVQGDNFIKKADKAKSKVTSQLEFLFKDAVVSILDKQIISNDDKKPIHPRKFSSDKPTDVIKDFSKFIMDSEENYLSWIEIEKKLLQTT